MDGAMAQGQINMGILRTEFWKVHHRCVHLGGPGVYSPGKNFKILDARIALVAIFCL